MQTINSFRGDYEFLSNGFPCNIEFDNSIYPSVEHAFQAAKTNDLVQRVNIMVAPTAADAKVLGKQVAIVADWDQKRLDVMASLIRQKFSNNLDLKLKLLMTGTQDLVQGGMRRDRYWGVDKNGVGENHLGKIIMTIRDSIRASEGGTFEILSGVLDKHGLGFIYNELSSLKEKSKDLVDICRDTLISPQDIQSLLDSLDTTISNLE